MNEIVHKSSRFIEVCQLLFVTDCSLKAKEILDTLTNTLFQLVYTFSYQLFLWFDDLITT